MTEKTMGSIKDVVIETAKGLLDIGLCSQQAYDEIVACFDEKSEVEEYVCCNHEGKGSRVETLPFDEEEELCCFGRERTIMQKQPPYVDVEERERGPGRVEVYVHSDLHTKNKGGAMVLVTSQTDFAAKTQMFIEFAKKCAKMFYAASHAHKNPTWEDVVGIFPDLIEEKAALETELREKIAVVGSAILTI